MQQITETLPKSAWDTVIVQENNEPLIQMFETNKITFSEYIKENPEGKFLRETVYEKLKNASLTLPEEYKLVIIEGYRSVASQQKSWDRMKGKVTIAWPELTEAEVEKKVGLYVAKPLPLANHNCGGAIDVTLAYTADNSPVDMGTLHPSKEDRADAIPKFMMFSEYTTKEQATHRSILRNTMVSAGFVWYPNEWWHYCYGDRMWAVYTNQKECFYGPIHDAYFLKPDSI